MNKKLLFGIMSLAALAACTNDDFESQQIAEQTSPVQFELLNNDAMMRASMGGNNDTKVIFSAADGDLFTLYHGGTVSGSPLALTAYQNATYKAAAADGEPAKLTTPSMINPGSALMVWPVDTAFTNNGTADVAIRIPAEQKKDIENYIPYVSDIINIGAYDADAPYNTAGKDRPYPVYMRPMGSQLIINADYAGSDETIAQLYAGGSAQPADGGIDPIKVTSMELLTGSGANTSPSSTTKFTTKVPLTFTAVTSGDANHTRWNTTATTKVDNNAWSHVTGFGTPDAPTGVDKLTTECLIENNGGAKFVVLPQAAMSTTGSGVDNAAVVVKTNYGKVVVAPNGVQGSQYDTGGGTTEIADAWYRITTAAATAADGETAKTTAETSGKHAGKYKTYANVEMGMKEFFNTIGTYTHKGTSPVQTEPEGVAGTRYVKVLLKYLDMSDLHITTDQQLRDAALVWKHMGLADVTVYLDGNPNNEFEISQNTIKVINEINAAVAGKDFKVKPCQAAGEVCNTIVITGGGNIKDLTFIKDNVGTKAVVAFKAGETWKWSTNNTVKVANTACGISKFVNRGTFTSDATATINVKNDAATPAWVNMPFENAEGATWNISANKIINVQFNVTNYGKVIIAKNAQYRQDGQAGATTFINEATAIPGDFTGGNDAKIGKVENKGVFATVSAGAINNYGLIEHADPDAKTYITANDNGGAGFGTAFGAANKMGRINLPYSNKNEDNVSVSAALNTGFVSVTVNGEVTGALDASVVGNKVNYVIVKSGITEIKAVSAQVKYLEINQPGTEIAWNVPTTTEYDGLIVLSDVNIKLGTKIIATTTYLGADMYVGGKFNQAAIAAETPDPAYPATNFNGYYGNTTGNVATKYITY